MDYFTVDGAILRTGYTNKQDWFYFQSERYWITVSIFYRKITRELITHLLQLK
jgi:hypothetical protein